jgi:hypothetical protein
MTALNEVFNTGMTVAYKGYSSGMFDCRSATGKVALTLAPSTTSPTTPGENTSVVYGSYFGLTLNLDGVPGSSDTDGTFTQLTYYDALDDDSGATTGHTALIVNSNATLKIGQLTAGQNYAIQDMLNASPGLPGGPAVQAAGGTWISLLPNSTGKQSIEMLAGAATWITNTSFDGRVTVTLDGPTSWTIMGLAWHGGVHTLVYCGFGQGVVFENMQPSVVQAHASVTSVRGVNYLTFQ